MKIATIFCWVITAFLYLMWSVFRENPPKIFFDGAPIMLYVSIFVTIGYIIRMKIKKKPKKDISETKIEKVNQPTITENDNEQKTHAKGCVIYHKSKNEYERVIIQFVSNDDGSAEIIEEMWWAATQGGSNGGQSVTVVPKEYFEENTIDDFRKMLTEKFSCCTDNYNFSSVKDNPIIGKHFAVWGNKDDKLSKRLFAKEASQFIEIYGFLNRTKEQKESLSYRTLVFDEETDKLYIRRGEVSGLTGHGFGGNPNFITDYTEVTMDELCETISPEDKQEMLETICKSDFALKILPFKFITEGMKCEYAEDKDFKENWETKIYETAPEFFDSHITYMKPEIRKIYSDSHSIKYAKVERKYLPEAYGAGIYIDLLSGQLYYSCSWLDGDSKLYESAFREFEISYDAFKKCAQKNSKDAYAYFKDMEISNWKCYVNFDRADYHFRKHTQIPVISDKYEEYFNNNRQKVYEKYYAIRRAKLYTQSDGRRREIYEILKNGFPETDEHIYVYHDVKTNKWILHNLNSSRKENSTIETAIEGLDYRTIDKWLIEYIIENKLA